jgi:hypothetical protein
MRFSLALFCVFILSLSQAQFFREAQFEARILPYVFQTGSVLTHGFGAEAGMIMDRWGFDTHFYHPYGRKSDSGLNGYTDEFTEQVQPSLTIRYSFSFGYEVFKRINGSKEFSLSLCTGFDYFQQSLGSGNWDYDSTVNGEIIQNFARNIYSVSIGPVMTWKRTREKMVRFTSSLKLLPLFSVHGDVRSYYKEESSGEYRVGEGYYTSRIPFGALIKYDGTHYLSSSVGVSAGINFQWYPHYNLPLGIVPRGGSSQLYVLGVTVGLVFKGK